MSIRFSGDGNPVSVFLNIDRQGFRAVRQVGGKSTVLKEYACGGPPPWEVRVLKKGNFFRFFVNGNAGWVRGPSGEWDEVYETWENTLELDGSTGCVIESCTVTTLPWLSQM